MIAPSSPFDRKELERGVARLRARYEVSYDPGIFTERGYLAGDDRRRGEELLGALEDPQVHAIVAARGGYGATRLLDSLDLDTVRRARKLLVGFSDITALHALFARAGLTSVHAAMVCALGRLSSDEIDPRWLAAVEGGPLAAFEGLRAISVADHAAEGPLLGGNLAVLHALCGTPHRPPLKGCVLLLEDVGEAPYRVDRMLVTLRQAGWLDGLEGVLLGDFSHCGPREDGVTVDAVLARTFADAPYPVLTGAPVGHGHPNQAVRLGATVRMDPVRGVARFPSPGTSTG